MYILHSRRKRTRSLLVLVVLLIALGAGAYYSRDLFDTDTTIGPAPAAVYSTVTDNRPKPKLFDDRLYSFNLPGDWEKFTIPNDRAGAQSWRNTKDNKGVRVITVYADANTQNMAVNRVMPVEVAGDHFMLAGDVSDNCINFTTKQADAKANIAAKWQGVDFVCDTGNRFRNVVGIGANAAPTGVVLTSASTGKHSIFITYTDSSANFSSNDLTEMVKSFKLK